MLGDDRALNRARRGGPPEPRPLHGAVFAEPPVPPGVAGAANRRPDEPPEPPEASLPVGVRAVTTRTVRFVEGPPDTVLAGIQEAGVPQVAGTPSASTDTDPWSHLFFEGTPSASTGPGDFAEFWSSSSSSWRMADGEEVGRSQWSIAHWRSESDWRWYP